MFIYFFILIDMQIMHRNGPNNKSGGSWSIVPLVLKQDSGIIII